MEASQTHPQEMTSYGGCGGQPLPLTKNIFPAPNLRAEVEKKLGGIMNGKNSENKQQPRG